MQISKIYFFKYKLNFWSISDLNKLKYIIYAL